MSRVAQRHQAEPIVRPQTSRSNQQHQRLFDSHDRAWERARARDAIVRALFSVRVVLDDAAAALRRNRKAGAAFAARWNFTDCAWLIEWLNTLDLSASCRAGSCGRDAVVDRAFKVRCFRGVIKSGPFSLALWLASERRAIGEPYWNEHNEIIYVGNEPVLTVSFDPNPETKSDVLERVAQQYDQAVDLLQLVPRVERRKLQRHASWLIGHRVMGWPQNVIAERYQTEDGFGEDSVSRAIRRLDASAQ